MSMSNVHCMRNSKAALEFDEQEDLKSELIFSIRKNFQFGSEIVGHTIGSHGLMELMERSKIEDDTGFQRYSKKMHKNCKLITFNECQTDSVRHLISDNLSHPL